VTIVPEPMPPWRERQILRLLADAPEPVWWGQPFRASLWVLAFLAFGAVCFEFGAIGATRECVLRVVG
jgi:hypothetical protein